MTASGLFARWTPAERWLAGLLWADGHLRPNITPGNDRITLAQSDRAVIDAAAAIVGSDHQVRVQEPRKPAHQPCYYLDFTDTSDELFRLGMEMKEDRRWPAEIASAEFVRGLFDGDGCVIWITDLRFSNRRYLRSMLDGPYAVLDGLQGWLADQGISPRKIKARQGCSEIRWSHYDSLRLAEIMYANDGPCMARKKARFREPR